MTMFKVGDIVSVEFPFSNLHTQKRRPELVLISGNVDLVVARVTSHAPRDPSDIALTYWAEIGCPGLRPYASPSWLRSTSASYTTPLDICTPKTVGR